MMMMIEANRALRPEVATRLETGEGPWGDAPLVAMLPVFPGFQGRRQGNDAREPLKLGSTLLSAILASSGGFGFLDPAQERHVRQLY